MLFNKDSSKAYLQGEDGLGKDGLEKDGQLALEYYCLFS